MVCEANRFNRFGFWTHTYPPLSDGAAPRPRRSTVRLSVAAVKQDEVFLSQFSKGLSERRLAFIDRNKELWLCPILASKGKRATPQKHKLHTQVRVQ